MSLAAIEIVQRNVVISYEYITRDRTSAHSFDEIGFKVYSQTNEDGIILYVFSVIGAKSRVCLEISAGSGIESNTANLIIYHRWRGILFDGDPALVDKGRKFFSTHPHTRHWPPSFQCAWITKDNVNDLVREAGLEGEIDLFSLDVDGNDYWIWRALTVVQPRVVVVEYRPIFDSTHSVTIPYDPDFRADRYSKAEGMRNYAGASLAAFVKLAEEKGYRLIGCNSLQFNAFFLRNGICDDFFPAIDMDDCLKHPRVRHGIERRLPSVAHLPWQQV